MKKIIQFVITPIIVLFIWFVMTFTFLSFSEFGFSSIIYKQTETSANNLRNKTILANHKVTTNIHSYENNLGIVSLNFVQTLDERLLKPKDILVFKIKEKGKKNWYQIISYPVNYVNNGMHFPFGFSKIIDSKGKEYTLELELVTSNGNLQLQIADEKPVITSVYIFDKNQILSSPKAFAEFFLSKYLAVFQYQTLNVIIFAFSVPIILGILFKLLTGPYIVPAISKFIIGIVRFLSKNIKFTKRLTQITFFSIFISTSLVEIPIIIYMIIGIIWCIAIYYYKLDGTSSLTAALLLLSLVPFLILFNREAQAEKIAFWVYSFLVIGTVQRLIEQNRNSISSFIKGIKNIIRIK